MSNSFAVIFKGEFCLFLAAFIWGSAFIFQKMGMDHIGPFTFGIFRFCLGALALLPVIWISGAINKRRPEPREITPFTDKTLWLGALLGGVSNFVAGSLQQVGLVYTTAGKAGFITSMSIVIVPLFLLFMRKKVGKMTWIGIAMATTGLYLLCITDGFSIGKGDFLVLICAFLFSLHILVIDYFSPKTDGVKMSCIQFLVCGILTAIPAIILEHPNLSSFSGAWGATLYAGVMSCGVAYTLQIVGQKNMNPTVASLILSLESCISVLAGWIILRQQLSTKEILGCVIMFAAIILAQLPQKQTE